MPANSPEYQRAYKKKHYAENKARYKEQAAGTKRRLRRKIAELKEQPCTDCGKSYPYYVMDFDHREGEEKIKNVSRLAASGASKQALVEIAKCDVVCSNCHRIRTFQRGCGVVGNT